LGAIKVSLVLFGIPALVAFLTTPLAARWLELSRGAEMATFVMILLLGVVAVLAMLVAWSRRVAKNPADYGEDA
jgi:hypothetical protein